MNAASSETHRDIGGLHAEIIQLTYGRARIVCSLSCNSPTFLDGW